MTIRKAIIPAAGLGTRFLPATKAMPKEMLPIVDKPTIQYIIEEAVASGIEDIIIVTGKGKRAIEDHFDYSFELEHHLASKNKWDLLDSVTKPSNIADIHYIRQKEPKGLGHAIWCARKFIGNEPFAVLLGDDIVESDTPCLKQLIDVYDQYESSVVGVQEVPWNEVSRYGIIDGKKLAPQLFQANGFIEKPARENAPSNLAIMGRYILTPEIFEILGKQEAGIGGEIQLTDAIALLGNEQNIYACNFEGQRHDVGEKFGFVQTTIHYALQHPELREQTMIYLREIVGAHKTAVS
ncbi:UTP--glucose-1-phosphate uridylyltransferase GalU [Paenibacillus pasadenensis]|uniref:UTP--glucose-1-phosphate uridylyltransferase GalU n=1 Tax=Paenibacillus pasadenensis TaxID=217090 RepID=UPI00203CBDBA|nr:UTP--glucose-1-phosphate uridylyltransferase GalU [Paenibacillus pasadenensis]MCM3747642.1 UTP--glucose-1-phosphate uridylyltransferase GalU [Paenibacillus pasadenensis]